MDDIEGRITSNRMITPGYYGLKIRLSRPMDPPYPGQFVMLRIPGNEVFLRRPFGIYHYKNQTLSILYKVVGKGTGCLANARKDEPVFVLGPLGKGFRISKRDQYLIVAGGIGVVGVHTLIEKLGKKATLFYGCSKKEEVSLIDDLARLDPAISTLNGSYGFKGNVIDLLGQHLNGMKTISTRPLLKNGKQGNYPVKGNNIECFACGPDNMLRSLRVLLEEEHLPCQVLVEERMACGLGLCFGCVKKTIDENEPYKRVCKEGPVFDLWEICL
jgi:dihydroorotate dehydrogenase electron transfer subunit